MTTETIGLTCPKCNSTAWTIDETRKLPGTVARNRVCRECGERIITEERFIRSAPKRFCLPKPTNRTGRKTDLDKL